MSEQRSFHRVSLALLALTFAATVWRAATQALTLDESLTYQLYVAGPWQMLVLHYDANHHILHSLLCRASAALWGHGELAIRVPALVSGLAYLLLARHLTTGQRAGPCSLLAFVLMAANPFVVDYLSLARGYGMALALFLAAFAVWVRFLTSAGGGSQRWSLVLTAGLLQALSLFSNLAFVAPVGVLALTAIALFVRLQSRAAFVAVWQVTWRLLLPALVVLVALGLPLVNARAHNFYFGTLALFDSARSLVAASLDHGGEWIAAAPLAIDAVTLASLAVAVVLGLGAIVAIARARPATIDATRLIYALAAANVLGAGAFWGILHHAAGVPWPRERTGLAFAPCFVLAATLATAALMRRPAWRPAGVVGAIALLGIATRFVAQAFTTASATGPYRTWRADSGAARVHAHLRSLAAGAAPVPVFCANFQKASLDYYNLRNPSTPPLLLLEHPVAGVRIDLVVVNPTFTPLQRDGDEAACDVPELGPVRGAVAYVDPVSGVVILRLP